MLSSRGIDFRLKLEIKIERNIYVCDVIMVIEVIQIAEKGNEFAEVLCT